MVFVDAQSVRRMHNDTVERLNRDEAARLGWRDRAAAQPVRRARGFTLLAGLCRLRLA